MIEVIPTPGTTIQAAAFEAVVKATSFDETVILLFNGRRIEVKPLTSPYLVVDEYLEKGPKCYEEEE